MGRIPREAKVFVCGHAGLVGSALVRKLKKEGFSNVITAPRKELDLTNEKAVDDFFTKEKPEYVFLAAAKVGGIMANATKPVEFILENLRIQNSVLPAADRHGVRKLLFLGSSCIYPKFSNQPIREEYLLRGELEPTNQWYSVAKIAGVKLCQALRIQNGFNAICVMPTNVYGPGDNFSLEDSHVLPAFVRRFEEAKMSGISEISCWGSGEARREFIHADDLASACLHLMENYDDAEVINVGTGVDIAIKDLAEIVKDAVGWKGSIYWDSTKPDGTPRKLLDVSKIISLGWKAEIPLGAGIKNTVEWFENRLSEDPGALRK